MRRRRLKRLLWRSSMWSATEGGGGNSGTRRRSSSAGGSLRMMALSSATPSGGLRGTLVDVPVTMLDKFQQCWFLLWKSLQSCSSYTIVFVWVSISDVRTKETMKTNTFLIPRVVQVPTGVW